MSNRLAIGFLICLIACCAQPLRAQDLQKQDLDLQYQLAVSDYEAGRFAQAAGELEKVLPYAATSSTVHELLGLVYASLNQSDKAMEQLKTAVQLKPDWVEARTNLGTALLHSGKAALAGEQFQKALALEPRGYDTNHNMGEFYVQAGKLAEARPLLQKAHEITPVAYDNSYDLAMTDFLLGRIDDARALVLDLVKQKDAGELHNLLGQIDEKDGKYVAAATDYEVAAHLDPSEDNLFDWGSEMLLHRTYEPAITVFQEAARRYPKSPGFSSGLACRFTRAANTTTRSRLCWPPPISIHPIRDVTCSCPRPTTAHPFRPTM